MAIHFPRKQDDSSQGSDFADLTEQGRRSKIGYGVTRGEDQKAASCSLFRLRTVKQYKLQVHGDLTCAKSLLKVSLAGA